MCFRFFRTLVKELSQCGPVRFSPHLKNSNHFPDAASSGNISNHSMTEMPIRPDFPSVFLFIIVCKWGITGFVLNSIEK